MEKNRLSNDVGRRLLARGLPPGEVRRYMVELRDHQLDLIDAFLAAGLTAAQAHCAAEARLGTPKQLARAATRRFRRTTFVGRHPLFFFGIAPAFVWFIMWIVVASLIYLAGYGISLTHWVPENVLAGIGSVCADITTLVVPCVFALLYYGAAHRRALAIGWRLFPPALGALSATWVVLIIRPPMMAVAAQPSPNLWSGLLPLAVMVLWILRRRRERRLAFA